MGKLRAGNIILKIHAILTFVLLGIYILYLLLFLIMRKTIPSEGLKIYDLLIIIFAVCLLVLAASGILCCFCRVYANKPLIITTIVFGFVLFAPLMVIGGCFLLSSYEYLIERKKQPKINDIVEDNEQLVILSRDEKRKFKTSYFREYANMWKKKSVGERVVLIIMFAIFLVYGFTLLFPLIWALYNSFKTTTEFDVDKFSLPMQWTIENYKEVFTNLETNGTNILTSLLNSIWMSLLSTILGLFASCLTAYVVAKYRFKASGLIYTIAIFIQIIPLVGGITGMYDLLWGKLQIADEPFLIWPIWFAGFGFSFLMLYSAFKSVPWSYAESAFIDGAGHFTTFIKIMLPAVKPILASLFVVNFMGAWNDYMTAYLYMPSYAPLSLAVYLLQNDATRIAYPIYLAVVVISVVPIITLFISFQKLIMENTSVGGLKG